MRNSILPCQKSIWTFFFQTWDFFWLKWTLKGWKISKNEPKINLRWVKKKLNISLIRSKMSQKLPKNSTKLSPKISLGKNKPSLCPNCVKWSQDSVRKKVKNGHKTSKIDLKSPKCILKWLKLLWNTLLHS